MILLKLIFYGLSLEIVACTLIVAFSGNIVRSAFALLGATLGIAGLYGFIGADYVAVAQVMIYVGGIMVLFLFAVMFTSRIAQVRATNRAMRRPPAALLCLAWLVLALFVIWTYPFVQGAEPPLPSAPRLGEALLGHYLLPLEVTGMLIVVTLVGAVVIGRFGKERR